jgi:hypothetical protein
VFFVITASHQADISIPEDPYSFAVLNDAQAIGDLEALQTHNRRTIRLHIKDNIEDGLDKLMAAIDFVESRRS